MGILVAVLSFAAYGALAGFQAGLAPHWVGLAAVVGALFGRLAATLIGWFARPAVRKLAEGRQEALAGAVNDGMPALIPFVALAALAHFGLGWPMVQAFASSGIMSASAGVGAAAARRAGSGGFAAFLPAVAGMALSAGWLMLCSALCARLGS